MTIHSDRLDPFLRARARDEDSIPDPKTRKIIERQPRLARGDSIVHDATRLVRPNSEIGSPGDPDQRFPHDRRAAQHGLTNPESTQNDSRRSDNKAAVKIEPISLQQDRSAKSVGVGFQSGHVIQGRLDPGSII